MDETTLVRDLLERATVPEPPIGPLPHNAVRAGTRLRRRRTRLIAAGAAAAAVACTAALAVTDATGNRTATPGNGATVYVLGTGMPHDTVTPIFAATNTPGQPIAVGPRSRYESSWSLPATRNGKTIYVADGPSAILPISTATNGAGRPIEVPHNPGQFIEQLVIAPDDKTVYVLDSGFAVIPISTATRRPGKPVELRLAAQLAEMAITPDGRTLYVAFIGSGGISYTYVVPIDTATDTPGRRIMVDSEVEQIVAAPNGKTVYLIGNTGAEIAVTPIATATDKPGKPIIIATGNVGTTSVVMTPNGETMYIPGNNLVDTQIYVIPFATATNRPGKAIRFDALSVDGMAVTPNGRTLYVATQPPGTKNMFSVPGDPDAYSCSSPQGEVTPIATATNTAGRPIKVGCRPLSITVTPDGKTVYVGASSNTVTPIDTATDRPGTPVNVLQPETITIAP